MMLTADSRSQEVSRMKPSHLLILVATIPVLLVAVSVGANVPSLVSYQGYLENEAGSPMTGPVDLEIHLYDSSTNGTSQWSETHTAVTLTNGVFNIALGSVTSYAPSLFDQPELWLEITVDGTQTLLPRTRILAVPYAMRAALADSVRGNGGASGSPWSEDQASVWVDGKNVGIGTSSPETYLHVAGQVTLEQKVFLRHPDIGVNATGSGLPDYDGDNLSEQGLYISSNNENRKSLRFRRTGTGVAGTGGIRWGDYDNDDFYLHRTDDGRMRLEYFNYSATPHTVDSILIVRENGLGSWKNDYTVNGLFTVGDGTGFPGKEFLRFNTERDWVVRQKGTGAEAALEVASIGGGGNKDLEVTTGGKFIVNGRAKCDVLEIAGADLVESFEVASDNVVPGAIVVIDRSNPGALTTSTQPYDRTVAGVVSGAGGISVGVYMGEGSGLGGDTPVAMTGRVYARCTTENGPIEPGDMLTTSSLSGHAMKATDRDRSMGRSSARL